MKKIKLTQGKYSIVDNEDFDYVNQYKWHLSDSRGKLYARRGDKRKKYRSIHRLILNCPDDKEPDHINGDGLDNRKSNLRIADRFQNTQNALIRKDSVSGFKGVNFSKRSNKWRAYIQYKKKNSHIGFFETKEEAAYVYDQFAMQLHGEFAKLNVLPQEELLSRL